MLVYSLANGRYWCGSVQRLMEIEQALLCSDAGLAELNWIGADFFGWWLIGKRYSELFCKTAVGVLEETSPDDPLRADLSQLALVHRDGDVVAC